MVVNSSIDQMCTFQTKADKLDNLILEEVHEGYFSAIKEEDEDMPGSEGYSKNSTDNINKKNKNTESLFKTENNADKNIKNIDTVNNSIRSSTLAKNNHNVIIPMPLEELSKEKSNNSSGNIENDISIKDNISKHDSMNSNDKCIENSKGKKKKYKSFTNSLQDIDNEDRKEKKVQTWVASESCTEKPTKTRSLLNRTLKGLTRPTKIINNSYKSTDNSIRNKLKYKQLNSYNNGNININININNDEFRKARPHMDYKRILKKPNFNSTKNKGDVSKVDYQSKSHNNSFEAMIKGHHELKFNPFSQRSNKNKVKSNTKDIHPKINWH